MTPCQLTNSISQLIKCPGKILNSIVAKENPTKKNLVKKNSSIIPQSMEQGCRYLEGSKQFGYMYEWSLFVVWPFLYDTQSTVINKIF